MSRLQRYVSQELAHFVGRGQPQEHQYKLLIDILRSGSLTHPPHCRGQSGNLFVNRLAKLSNNEMYSPQMVCFCDIPVEDLQIHTTKYSRFGFSLSKQFVVQQGGAPVLYLPRATRIRTQPRFEVELPRNYEGRMCEKDVSLAELFDRMVPEYHALMDLFSDLIVKVRQTAGVPEEAVRLQQLQSFLAFRLLSYVKFFDSSLNDDDPENFYMEREWRVVGNVSFRLEDVQRVFVPSAYSTRLRDDIPDFCGQVTFVY